MAGWQTQGMIAYQFTSLAIEDLFEIWSYIARDNPEAANAVEEAIYRACALLANAPLAGRIRPDLTHLPLRFWFVQPYRNYVIVYDPSTKPLQIIRVLHGARNISTLLP
ncbi:MAG TPA: type II toxin-antitoxin system RelE/ParE family toxin [Candidatus Angelobacter sp.]|nr:type II toxin-antitoxin system RelE/ParE family toxin [Candidatus Angelobacter sp.]